MWAKVLLQSQPSHTALKWMLMEPLDIGLIPSLFQIKEGVLVKLLAWSLYLQDRGQVVAVLGQPTLIWVINLCCKYGEVIWLSVPTG